MANLTAKRTLVKSPPELWTELSELEGLERHLGEFGEIRITKVEPERTVAWEGESVCGTVELEASGWGTKVTLTAAVSDSATPAEPARAEPEAVSAPEPASLVDPAPVVEPAPVVDPASVVEPAVSPSETTAASTPERAPGPGRPAWDSPPPRPEPASRPVPSPWEPPRPARPAQPERRGFLSRMFGRTSGAPAAARPTVPRGLEYPARAETGTTRPPLQPSPRSKPEPVRAARPAPPEPQRHAPPDPQRHAPPEPGPKPEPKPEYEPQPANSAAGAKADPPALDADRALAVLEGALDTLGSAHHRPFSRG